MRTFRSLSVSAFVLLAILFLAPAMQAHAQMPAYLHAISDLRTARAWLQQDSRPQIAPSRNHAIEEISKAIDDMKRAAARDGKDLDQVPPPHNGGDPNAPAHTAMRLLDEAYNDVARGADAPQNQGLQARSLRHIDMARAALRNIFQGQP
jgi:hypothetical protein